jgi:hypothetical protein
MKKVLQNESVSSAPVFHGLNAGALSFREFMVNEPLPLSAIHEGVFEFIRGRDDVAVFGAHAVNAYISEPRMTQNIDLMSLSAEKLCEELREYLSKRFHIAVRVRNVSTGKGYRLYQIQKSGNRHLVDIRHVETMPTMRRIGQIQVVAPPHLIAEKVVSYSNRRNSPKSGTDWRDIAMLLLKFPELKNDPEPVAEVLQTMGAGPDILKTWLELTRQDIRAEVDEGDI